MCQVFQVARENLQNIMDGYCIGEPHFSQRLEENVNTLIKALRDPALPLLELQVRYRLIIAGFMKKGYRIHLIGKPIFILAISLQEMISSISGRIPVSVEETIKRHLSNYASNITSVLSQFPSQQVNCYHCYICC